LGRLKEREVEGRSYHMLGVEIVAGVRGWEDQMCCGVGVVKSGKRK